MPQSLARVLVHLVFRTRHCAALPPPARFAALHAYALHIFRTRKCHLVEMNHGCCKPEERT